MESRHVLSIGSGDGRLADAPGEASAESELAEIQARLTRHAPLDAVPAARRAPGRPENADATARRRGDDDLNPGLIDPARRMVEAAVLVPLLRRPSGPSVLLTRRTAHLHDHAGQICFPGGRIESHDPSPAAAALREAEEEVGLPPSGVTLAGRLDTYETRTGYRIAPFVGLVTPPEALRAEDFEVAEIFEVPLAFLRAPGSRQMHSLADQGTQRHFWVFPYGDYYIWGATAGMLVNLVDVLETPC